MINRFFTTSAKSLVALMIILLGGCGIDHRTVPDPASLPNRTLYFLTNNGQLIQTNLNNLNRQATQTISGLTGGEMLLAIDFRPATGQLYALSDQNRLYTINPATAVANLVTGLNPTSPIGTVIGFDFNPTVDLLRVVTSSGLNLRVNPVNGVVVTDTPISSTPASPKPQIGAVAYSGNTSGSTATVLYDVDPVTDQLYTQTPANNGTLARVGSLGIDITAVGGFDIAPSGEGLMTVLYQGQLELSSVNLATGFLQKLANLPGNIIGLAIPTDPVAYSVQAYSNNLLIFNPTQTNAAPIAKTITGTYGGEGIESIDFRPKNGQLYGVSSSRLYTINVATGVATQVPTVGGFEGGFSGFDFDPVTDRIRLMNGYSTNNFSINPDNGQVSYEGFLPNRSRITAAAYSNNYAGASSTRLYTIDYQEGTLNSQNPPSSGTQTLVGSLKVGSGVSDGSIDPLNGFDIGGQSGIAYLLTVTANSNRAVALYQVNLQTGAATQVSILAGVNQVNGLAVGLGF